MKEIVVVVALGTLIAFSFGLGICIGELIVFLGGI